MSHIFISYKRDDYKGSGFLRQLEENLDAANIEFWRDTRIQSGENRENAIDTAITDCYALLLLMSDNVSESQYVTYEWTRALTLGKPVIPIKLSEKSVLHPRLVKTQFIDFTRNTEESWKMLTVRLQTLQTSYHEAQSRLREEAESENRRIYHILESLYEVRITGVTAEDLLDQLHSHSYLSLLDYASLIDMSRKNQQHSKND